MSLPVAAAVAIDRPIVVVGAGMGGLAAAVALGAAGRRVLLLEAAASVGGATVSTRDKTSATREAPTGSRRSGAVTWRSAARAE